MTGSERVHLFWKLGLYYGACFALIIGVAQTFPEWMKFLPFGGLDTLQRESILGDGEGLSAQVLASHRPEHLFDDALNLFSAFVGTLVIMIPLRWLYMADGLKKSWNREVAASLLVLPLIVASIVYVVKYSLPLAFALTGIFAGVRYRTTLKSQSDAYFTFTCIAIGLSAGIRSLGIGLLLATFFALTMLAAPPGRSESASDTDQ